MLLRRDVERDEKIFFVNIAEWSNIDVIVNMKNTMMVTDYTTGALPEA